MDDNGLWTGDPEADKRRWQEEAYSHLNNLRATDPQVGQLIMMINAADEDNRLRGAGHFVWAMSEGASFAVALIGACEAAGLEAPAEDLGPVDKLFDRARKSFVNPDGATVTGRVTAFVRRHAQARHPKHN